MSDTAEATVQKRALQVFEMNLLLPGVGVIPLDVKAPDMPSLIEFWWEMGYIDAADPHTGARGRFSKMPGACLFERVQPKDGPKVFMRAPLVTPAGAPLSKV